MDQGVLGYDDTASGVECSFVSSRRFCIDLVLATGTSSATTISASRLVRRRPGEAIAAATRTGTIRAGGAADSLSSDPERIARFEREAKVLASSHHAHIAPPRPAARSGGRRRRNFLVMELVEGGTLQKSARVLCRFLSLKGRACQSKKPLRSPSYRRKALEPRIRKRRPPRPQAGEVMITRM